MTNHLVSRTWRQAGDQLGLAYNAALNSPHHGMVLSGAIDGFPTRVLQRFYRSADQAPYTGTSTLFKIELQQLKTGSDFMLQPSRSVLRRLHVFNRRDIFVGEREWDYAFVVRGADPEAVRRFLTSQRRVTIAGASPHRLRWMLRGTDLTHSFRYLATEEQLIVTRVQQLIGVAKAITLGRT